jgi:hypothetical protein
MADPIIWGTPQLTGRTRHRQSLLGKMVLQVEERQRRVNLAWVTTDTAASCCGGATPASRIFTNY